LRLTRKSPADIPGSYHVAQPFSIASVMCREMPHRYPANSACTACPSGILTVLLPRRRILCRPNLDRRYQQFLSNSFVPSSILDSMLDTPARKPIWPFANVQHIAPCSWRGRCFPPLTDIVRRSAATRQWASAVWTAIARRAFCPISPATLI
jgi:hypothetical protein